MRLTFQRSADSSALVWARSGRVVRRGPGPRPPKQLQPCHTMAIVIEATNSLRFIMTNLEEELQPRQGISQRPGLCVVVHENLHHLWCNRLKSDMAIYRQARPLPRWTPGEGLDYPGPTPVRTARTGKAGGIQ